MLQGIMFGIALIVACTRSTRSFGQSGMAARIPFKFSSLQAT